MTHWITLCLIHRFFHLLTDGFPHTTTFIFTQFWLTHWLTLCLINRFFFTHWQTDSLSYQLAYSHRSDSLIKSLSAWFIDSFPHWQTDSLTHKLAYSLSPDWLTDSPSAWFIHSFPHWQTDSLTQWLIPLLLTHRVKTQTRTHARTFLFPCLLIHSLLHYLVYVDTHFLALHHFHSDFLSHVSNPSFISCTHSLCPSHFSFFLHPSSL